MVETKQRKKASQDRRAGDMAPIDATNQLASFRLTRLPFVHVNNKLAKMLAYCTWSEFLIRRPKKKP